MVLLCKGLEYISRYQFQKLRKQSTLVTQGLISFLLFNGLW